jgi:hypothetical protein
MRPFFPYYGSKWNISRYYPKPKYSKVIEPFAGSAGYSTFFDVPSAKLSDADPVIVGIWSYLLRSSEADIMSLPEMPEPGDSVDNYRIPEEAKWLIGFWLNRGSAQPKKTRTEYSSRSDRSQLNWGSRAKIRIASQLRMIEGWSVSLDLYANVPNEYATWYVDPPYVDKGKYYRVRFREYKELGAWCMSRRGQVIVCEGPGATWLPFEPLGSYKSSKGKATEMIFVKG